MSRQFVHLPRRPCPKKTGDSVRPSGFAEGGPSSLLLSDQRACALDLRSYTGENCRAPRFRSRANRYNR